jgi:hypothetical protein
MPYIVDQYIERKENVNRRTKITKSDKQRK